MKKNYKIVASDLDGTLLAKDQTVSRENLDAIAAMRKAGIEFVPTTGRALCEIPEALITSPSIRYFITSDGAVVWDNAEKKTLLTEYIPTDLVKFMLDTIRPYTVYTVVHESGVTYYDPEKHTDEYLTACRLDSYFRHIIDTTAIPKPDFENFLLNSDKVEMLAFFFETDEAIEACRRAFVETGKLCAAHSAVNNLEVYVSKAGKGNTLAALAKTLGVDLADVIAVGDSNNDSTLIKTAGLGLAMANASDELKAIADKTICDRSEHCAKYILEDFIDC